MKKICKIALLSLAVVAILMSFSACTDPALKEVAGTYELTSVSGSVSGVNISNSSYEYFRIILKENGKGIVQSKGSAIGSVAYEATGTFKYENGIIKMTTKNGNASVTEEYEYADGVITYSMDAQGMKFTAVFTRVIEE